MPLYEYLCSNCGVEFEVLRKISQADAPFPCHNCHESNIQRKISLFSAKLDGKVIASTTNNCDGCSGGNCSSCH